MKPAQERNQECLPPKKRDLLVNNSGGVGGTVGGGAAGVGGSGGTGGGGSAAVIGEDEAASVQSSGATSDPQGASATGEWLQTQPGLHYGVDNSDSVPAVPVDQYSMLYKVALPSVTYSPTTLHPVLSHISSAYTVHSPLLQHPGLPYPPLGYAQIPHSSLQFVSSPYTAVPYALPPGFVPGSLISPSGTIPQPHTVSHLVPYQSVIQEGVVSPPPQAQVAAHAFAKVAASGTMPLMLPSEQAAQQHLSTVGVLPAKDVSSRGMPVFYHTQGARASIANRDAHSAQHENEPEMNGREQEQGMREAVLESGHIAKNTRLPQATSSSAAQEHSHDRGLLNRRLEERSSPGQPSTPESDLEVSHTVWSVFHHFPLYHFAAAGCFASAIFYSIIISSVYFRWCSYFLFCNPVPAVYMTLQEFHVSSLIQADTLGVLFDWFSEVIFIISDLQSLLQTDPSPLFI